MIENIIMVIEIIIAYHEIVSGNIFIVADLLISLGL